MAVDITAEGGALKVDNGTEPKYYPLDDVHVDIHKSVIRLFHQRKHVHTFKYAEILTPAGATLEDKADAIVQLFLIALGGTDPIPVQEQVATAFDMSSDGGFSAVASVVAKKRVGFHSSWTGANGPSRDADLSLQQRSDPSMPWEEMGVTFKITTSSGSIMLYTNNNFAGSEIQLNYLKNSITSGALTVFMTAK